MSSWMPPRLLDQGRVTPQMCWWGVPLQGTFLSSVDPGGGLHLVRNPIRPLRVLTKRPPIRLDPFCCFRVCLLAIFCHFGGQSNQVALQFSFFSLAVSQQPTDWYQQLSLSVALGNKWWSKSQTTQADRHIRPVPPLHPLAGRRRAAVAAASRRTHPHPDGA